MNSITVRPVSDEDGFLQCQDILIKVWDLENGGQRNIIPTRVLQVSREYGGVVLGAYSWENVMVGFVWAFPAIGPDNSLFLFSDTLAVLMPHRDQGIGTRLKFAQRLWALQHGISLIKWTYDPLEARNGYLNIRRFGGVAHTYKRNLYGIGTSGPNKGLETDRLIVDWHLNSTHVEKCACQARRLIPPPDIRSCLTLDNRNEQVIPKQALLEHEEPELLIPLPVDFQLLKQRDMGLAREWRLIVRHIFEAYFERGYAVVDYHVVNERAEKRGYYRMARNWMTVLNPTVEAAANRQSL